MFKLTLSVRNFVYYHQHHCRLFGKMTIVMMTMTVVMMTMIVVMMTMTVVMMTMTVATCLSMATGKSCRPHALALRLFHYH